jgi:hypothetical protein
MKEIGRCCCEAPGQPVTVDAMVSFLGLQEMAFLELMVLFSFIKRVF